MKKYFYPLLFFFTYFMPGFSGQAQDAGDHMFDPSIVHEIRFDFTEPNYFEILTNNFDISGGSAIPYLMAKVTIDGEVIDSVGVRFKGFTSYSGSDLKKPLKIDFNEFVSGKRYDGLRKLNLNNGTGDPGLQRDVVCYDLMRGMGVKAPRTSYSKVYFNDTYWGLYQSIEQVDKEFLKRNFKNAKGNLFKNKGWSHFEWLGNDPDYYAPPFELKTNETLNDWTGFVNLMDVLNNSSDAAFPEAIEEIFNVDLFLKTLAVDVATNNWDSYLEHGRNWYIYEDTVTGVFHWIPWDYNFALAGGFGGGGSSGDCDLFPRLTAMTNGTTKVDFFDHSWYPSTPDWMWTFGDGNSSTAKNPSHEYAFAGEYEVCITLTLDSNCTRQSCRTVNTNTNPADCQSIVDGTCPHPVNLFFQQTIDFNPTCCSTWSSDCEDLYGWLDTAGTGGGFKFDIDQRANDGILIRRLLSVPEFNDRYYNYFCSLLDQVMVEPRLFDLIDRNKDLISDGVQQDPHFIFTYDQFLEDVGDNGIKAVLSDRIQELETELSQLTTCLTPTASVPFQDVAINELVASNDSTSNLTDPAGEFDDWIELYNNTSSPIDLTGVFLSDNFQEPQKWKFPDGTTIAANDYMIIWADKDETQNGLHADFKLSKDGEELILSNADGSVIDSLTFGEQTTNIAYARIPNGTGNFVFQPTTHNVNNENASSTSDLNNPLNAWIYPNPASSQLEVNIQYSTSRDHQVSLLTSTGQEVFAALKNDKTFSLDVSAFPNGFYFLQISNRDGQLFSQKLIITH